MALHVIVKYIMQIIINVLYHTVHFVQIKHVMQG